jgi:hypothetical protein
MNSHTIKLIEECIKFTYWAAGEGLAPSHADDTRKDPEDIFLDYSVKTDDEDWEGLAGKISGELNELLSTQLGVVKD